MKLTGLFDKGQMPKTTRYLSAFAASVKETYEDAIRESVPAWWGRMALSTSASGGGGILLRRIAGGIQVFYANKGDYDYLSVIEKGRGRFSIKDALLRSPKARNGKHGRYIVIPWKAESADNSPVMKRSGFRKDAEGKRRINYRTLQGGSSRTVAMAQGPVKGGGMQRASMKFISVSERSRGWMYPKIQANPISRRLQEQVNARLEKDEELAAAIRADIEAFLQKQLG